MAKRGPHLARAARERSLASGVLGLLRNWSAWVHRRVETIALEDKLSERRRISVDFTLPRDLEPVDQVGERGGLFFVPLTLLEKRPLTQFDLRDESGASLPLLTRERNGRLATAVLVCFAEERYRSATDQKPTRRRMLLPNSIGRDLETIARGDIEAAEYAWENLQAGGADEADTAQKWRQVLSEDDAFMALAWDLARSFIVAVPLLTRPGSRRILKFAYLQLGAEPLIQRPKQVNWLLERVRAVRGQEPTVDRLGSAEEVEEIPLMGWIGRFLAIEPKEIKIEVPSVGWGASYHLEVEAPDGLQITTSMLGAVDEGKERVDYLAKSVQRAHMYLSDLGQAAFARAYLEIRPRSGTILRAAAITSTITTALLGVYAVRWGELAAGDLGLVVSLLLLIPGGLSAYVARPREPDVTTSVLFGARLVAIAPAAWAIAGALVLTAGRTCDTNLNVTTCTHWGFTSEALWTLVAASLLTTLVLILGWRRAARPPECVAD